MSYILIAEDEAIYGKILKKHLLDATGRHVLHVSNGAEALHGIRQHAPEILVLDLIMPVMNGFEVLHTLNKCEDITRPTKIIVLSNLEQEKDIQAVKEMGADLYIGKSTTEMYNIIDLVNSELQKITYH